MAFVIMERLFRAFELARRATEATARGGGEELGFFACHNSSQPTRDSFKGEIYGRTNEPANQPARPERFQPLLQFVADRFFAAHRAVAR